MSFTHQIGPYPQSPAKPDSIDFRIGQPSPFLLPLEAIERAAWRQLATDPLVLQYGTRRGYLPFREALAQFLSSRYRHSVSADQLAVTASNSLALSLASQVLASRIARWCAVIPPTFWRRVYLLHSESRWWLYPATTLALTSTCLKHASPVGCDRRLSIVSLHSTIQPV